MSDVRGRPRSAQTCQRCRKLKTRCDKARPRCSRCSRVNAQCEYPGLRPSLPDLSGVSASLMLDEPILLSAQSSSTSSGIQLPSENGRSHNGFPQLSDHTSKSSENTPQEKPRLKRERATLSCLRCKRLKVRCDRRLPCSRCKKVGRDDECTYPNSVNGDAFGSHNLQDERVLKLIATTFIDSTWHKRFRNGTHWVGLLHDMSDLLPLDRGKKSLDELTGPKSLSINFPFCEDEDGSGDLVRGILSTLPPHTMQKVFIDHYKNSIGRMYHIIDNDSWDQETEAFWEQSSAFQHDWLAVYFMVLSLGCQAYKSANHGDPGHEQFDDLPRRLLKGAKVCLQRSPFMFRSSLANIRTICLMIIAKQVYTMSCHEADTCWPLLGVAVRLSISMGLHLVDPEEAQRSPEDGGSDPKIKYKLWETVVVLEMRQSMVCGMPLLLRSDSLKIGGLFGGGGELIMRALDIATSQDDIPSYDTAVEIDAALRQHLRLYKSGKQNLDFPIDDNGTDPIDLEECKMEIFSRQVLMALHSRFALAPNSASIFPVSYFSSLESALALLSKQRLLCDNDLFGKQYSWVAGFFRPEFFTAAMVVCCQLVRGTPYFTGSPDLGENQGPGDIMLDALESCRDIWGKDSQKSICNSNAFAVTDNLVRVLRGRGI